MKVLAVMVTLYRLNPLRPHCNAEAGVHVYLCRKLMTHIAANGAYLGPECDMPKPPSSSSNYCPSSIVCGGKSYPNNWN
jgi:hypothetical protein